MTLALCLITLLVMLFSSGSAAGDFSLENSRLSVMIESDGFVMHTHDKASGREYRSFRLDSISFLGGSSSSDSCYFRYSIPSGDFPVDVTVSLDNNAIAFTLSADHDAALSKAFSFPGPIETGEDEYYVIPRTTGFISPVTEPCPFGTFHMWTYKATMAFAGVTDLESGHMIVSSDPWDSLIEISRPDWKNPCYSLTLKHEPSMQTFGYDRHFAIHFIDRGGYVTMCGDYRKHAEKLGYVKTLREKAAENPAIDRLIGAVDFWTHTTYYGKELIEQLVDYGFDRVLFTIPSGYMSYDDHSELIDTAHEAGYLTSRYDCFTDVYPAGEHPEVDWLEREGYPENIIVNADGSLHKGWITYLEDGTAFQCGVSCSVTHGQYARRKIDADIVAGNDYSARFIDVELASLLKECYSATHPASRHDDAIHRTETLGIVKNEYGLVTGSEEAREWAFSNCDYGEGTMTLFKHENSAYNWADPVENPGGNFVDYSMNAAYRVPLHPLVYHDCHVPTWYTGDGATKVPGYWDNKDLLTALYGTMQLFMAGKAERWEENLKRFVTSYHTTSSIFRNVAYERMTGHEMLTPDFLVQKSSFANGWEVVANFRNSSYTYNGKTIAAMGLYAGNGGEEVMKIEENGSVHTAVALEDRIYLAPGGRQTEYNGVRSTGPVFICRESDNRLHAACIATTPYIDIKGGELPWPAESFEVFDKNGNSLKQYDLGDGWIRINRPGGNGAMTIDYIPATNVENTEQKQPQNVTLNIHPNPFNAVSSISYTLPKQSHVTLELINVAGQKVAVLTDTSQRAGNYSVAVDGAQLTSGLYFARLATDTGVVTQKLTLVK